MDVKPSLLQRIKNIRFKENNMGEKSNIGEYWRLQEYVEDQYQKKYGKEVMDDFRERALVPPESNQKFKKIIKKDEIVVKSIQSFPHHIVSSPYLIQLSLYLKSLNILEPFPSTKKAYLFRSLNPLNKHAFPSV